jgi:hypothetical protein
MQSSGIMTVRLLIIALIALSAPALAAQIGNTGTVVYSRLHFSLELPAPYEKHSVAPAANEDLHDIYITESRAYVIRVIKASDDLPASTAIEKIIQEQTQSGSKLGSTNRWEMDSRDKVLFKGCTRSVDINEPLLKTLFGEGRCIECVSMAALGDEFSPIISAGVMGRADQSDDIEALAKYLAFTVRVVLDKPALPAPPGKLIRRPAPALRSPASRPGYSSKSISAAPRLQQPRPLKKGEIKLEGTIGSIDSRGASMIMQVSRITMPGSKPALLVPARQKEVLYSKLPPGVAVGNRIIVIGRNNGVGKPIRADVLAIQ